MHQNIFHRISPGIVFFVSNNDDTMLHKDLNLIFLLLSQLPVFNGYPPANSMLFFFYCEGDQFEYKNRNS